MEKRPIGKIGADPCQGFIHGHIGMTVSADASLIGQGQSKCLPQADTQVFHGVMVIDLHIPLSCDFKIKKSMDGKQGQHMIHKPDAGANGPCRFRQGQEQAECWSLWLSAEGMLHGQRFLSLEIPHRPHGRVDEYEKSVKPNSRFPGEKEGRRFQLSQAEKAWPPLLSGLIPESGKEVARRKEYQNNKPVKSILFLFYLIGNSSPPARCRFFYDSCTSFYLPDIIFY
jgi:hypothetical protein